MAGWQSALSRAAPRVAALTWAAYAITRVAAYASTSPPQLRQVHEILPLWIPWTVAATLLILGGLVPPRAGRRSKALARGMRQWGSVISTMTLGIWAVAFLLADASRGWVSAVNYFMLTAFAVLSGWIMSREVASVRAVRGGDAYAPMD